MHGIKFRPNKPAGPHLNGKWNALKKQIKSNLTAPLILPRQIWMSDSLSGSITITGNALTVPIMAKLLERYNELAGKTPFSDKIAKAYHPDQEHIQEQNYRLELQLRKLK